MRCTRSALMAVLMVGAVIRSAESQATTIPVVFVSGFVTHDSLSMDAATRLRSAFPAMIPATKARILSTRFVQDQMNSGSPDDFGGSWGLWGVKMAAREYRAHVVVEVKATR